MKYRNIVLFTFLQFSINYLFYKAISVSISPSEYKSYSLALVYATVGNSIFLQPTFNYLKPEIPKGNYNFRAIYIYIVLTCMFSSALLVLYNTRYEFIGFVLLYNLVFVYISLRRGIFNINGSKKYYIYYIVWPMFNLISIIIVYLFDISLIYSLSILYFLIFILILFKENINDVNFKNVIKFDYKSILKLSVFSGIVYFLTNYIKIIISDDVGNATMGVFLYNFDIMLKGAMAYNAIFITKLNSRIFNKNEVLTLMDVLKYEALKISCGIVLLLFYPYLISTLFSESYLIQSTYKLIALAVYIYAITSYLFIEIVYQASKQYNLLLVTGSLILILILFTDHILPVDTFLMLVSLLVLFIYLGMWFLNSKVKLHAG